MKALLCSLLMIPAFIFGQNLSASTNEIHLNFNGEGLPNATDIPVIHWVSPRLEYTTSLENQVNIQAEAKSYYPLKEIKIVIGERSSGIIYGNKVLDIGNGLKNYLINQTINLPDGSCFVEIVVRDDNGVVVSGHRDMLVGAGSVTEAVLVDRKDYALLFVTDKYDNWDDLVNPVDDGRSIAKELKEKYGFNVEIVENPTVDAVWEKLREYSTKKFKPQDQLLVFFAGHGQFDETFGEGYIVAKNSLKKDPSRNSYISHNRLRGVINNIPSEHILLVMDVCYGGTLDPVIARARGNNDEYIAPINEVIARKLNTKTRKYLTSGGKEYVSDGVAGKHSPFASKLLESLGTYGGDDGILTLLEIVSKLENLKVLPRFGSFGDESSLSDFIFIAKRN